MNHVSDIGAQEWRMLIIARDLMGVASPKRRRCSLSHVSDTGAQDCGVVDGRLPGPRRAPHRRRNGQPQNRLCLFRDINATFYLLLGAGLNKKDGCEKDGFGIAKDFMGITLSPELSAVRLSDEKAYAIGIWKQCRRLWRSMALRSP